MKRSRFARGTQRTEHDPAAVRREVRRETMRQARVAAFRGDHAEASRLYALCNVVYCVERNDTVRTRDGLDKEG